MFLPCTLPVPQKGTLLTSSCLWLHFSCCFPYANFFFSPEVQSELILTASVSMREETGKEQVGGGGASQINRGVGCYWKQSGDPSDSGSSG